MNRCPLMFSSFLLATAAFAAAPALVPAPRQYVAGEGSLVISAKAVTASAAVCTCDASLPKEGYVLTVAKDGVKVRAGDAAGEFYAIETLKQMAAEKAKGVYEIPCATVTDSPRFRWRGIHLDEVRHFFGKETVKLVLDQMAMHKLNVFHWHLTDDQGWRLAIPKYPELVKYGAVRPHSPKLGAYPDYSTGDCVIEMNDEQYGPFYYTRKDIEEIVAYAAARHITVVPEIEIPGHVYAMLAAYPEFACVPENLKARQPRVPWGIEKDVLCVGNPAAIKFFEDVFDYVCEVFPSEVVHIGGDETPRTRWEKCPKCQAFMKANGIKDVNGIQAWVTRHFADYLAKKGRRILGWDEILAGDVPKSAMGMCWRTAKGHGAGTEFVSGAAGAIAGHDMVMTPVDFCYLNYSQGLADDPYQYTREHPSPSETVTLAKAYAFDPLAGVPESAQAHVLGGQGNHWSEFIWSRFDLAWKMWPRAAALAEVLWTYPAQPRDYEGFVRRMAVHRDRLVKAQVNCAPIQAK